VSSTYTDLVPYRKAVWDKLEKLKLAVNGMEIFGARSAEALDTCIQEVLRSEIFVAILGMRFGSVDSKTGKSFVQVEYETAVQNKLDALVYLIDEEHALLPPKFVDTGDAAQRLKEFKQFLRDRHTVDFFISPDDLAVKTERDLLRLFKERQLTIDDGKLEPLSEPEKTLELLKKFDLMPSRFEAAEVELIIKFSGNPRSVSEKRCLALGLPVGYSLSRPINVVEPPEASRYRFLDELLAQYEGCEFLYQSPDHKEYRVICKLEFGIEKSVVQTPINPFPSPNAFLLTRPIKDLETGETIDSYITSSNQKAVIFVKMVGGPV
jgi:hypothetical protein